MRLKKKCKNPSMQRTHQCTHTNVQLILENTWKKTICLKQQWKQSHFLWYHFQSLVIWCQLQLAYSFDTSETISSESMLHVICKLYIIMDGISSDNQMIRKFMATAHCPLHTVRLTAHCKVCTVHCVFE